MKRLLILAMGLLLAASAHAAFAVKAGSTSVLVPYFKFIDTTTGTAKTDITGTDIDLSYVRAQADHSAKVDAVAHAAIDDAWDDDEVFEIDDTLHPGLWRIDWPDAAFADGADWVILTATVSGAYSVSMLVWLVDYDPQDTVRLGLTALPPAAADAAGGLPISDAGELDLDTLLGHLDADISSRGTSTLTEDSNIGIDLDDTTGTLSDAEVDDDAIGDGTNLTEAGGDGDHLTEAGGDGDQFTGIAWDGDWDAAVESEVNDALVALNLDHFLKTAVNDPANLGGDGGSEVVENTVMALWLASDGDSDGYNYTTDSAEAIRDQGDAAWTTGGGTGLTALASGTAQSGTASTIVLAAAAAFANDELNGNTINIHTGTGAGQSRVIISNTLADDTCNVYPNWTTNPGADSQYEIVQGSANLAAVALNGAAAQKMLFTHGMVWVDAAGTASTAWPYGTATYPTDTIARGKTIADANGLNSIRVKGSHTLAAAMEKYNFYGGLMIDTTELITLGGFSTEHSSFERLVITGASGNAALVNDATTFVDCYLWAVTDINGWAIEGRVEGACSIKDAGYATFQNVLFGSGLACTLTVQAPSVCDIENMAGELTLAGMDGGVCSVSMSRGSILNIAASCTAGTITVTGAGTVVDESDGATVTVQVAEANAVQISGDATAADNLEAMADGTGSVLTLSQLHVAADDANGGIYVTNAGGPGLEMSGTYGFKIAGTTNVGGYLQGAMNKYGLHVYGLNMRAIYLEATAAAIDSDAPVIFSGSLADQVATVAADVAGLDGDAMRGTDNAALAATALSNVTWTDARAGALTDWIDGGRLDLILDIIAADVVNLDGDAMRGTDNAALAATALSIAQWTNARAVYLDQLAAAAMPATIATILADTNELQTNQGNWLTAAGFSTLTQAQVRAQVDAALAAYPAAKPTDVRIIIP